MARQRLGGRREEFHFAAGVAGGNARAATRSGSAAPRSGAWTGARVAAWCERQRDAAPLARRTAAARAGEVDAGTAALVIVREQKPVSGGARVRLSRRRWPSFFRRPLPSASFLAPIKFGRSREVLLKCRALLALRNHKLIISQRVE